MEKKNEDFAVYYRCGYFQTKKEEKNSEIKGKDKRWWKKDKNKIKVEEEKKDLTIAALSFFANDGAGRN